MRYRPTLLPVLLLGLAGCTRTRADADAQAAREAPADTACLENELRPATGAPAQGLWIWAEPRHRVAAIVGPAQTVTGRAQVTRRVETVEARDGADTIRFASETAAVRLEFVPPSAQPAAVYAVGPLVLLASYEPCSLGRREPAIRYLRQDRGGRVQTDVMLQRASGAP